MIRGILHGYYRTGTTILWWILQKSNPEIPIIYEPHSPGVIWELKSILENLMPPDLAQPLHGMPICQAHFMLGENVINRYLENVVPKPIYTEENIDEAIDSIFIFHELDRDVYIKSNQLLCINSIAEKFKCKYVHIFRDPVEVLYSHMVKGKEVGDIFRFNLFYVSDILSVGRKLGWITGLEDNITAFLKIYLKFNHYIYSNLDKRGLFVKFEDIVSRPGKYMRIVAEHLGLKVDEIFLKVLDKSKVFRADRKFRDLVESRYTAELKSILGELRCI